jgi:23S rRNA pseudouridine2605 synthase
MPRPTNERRSKSDSSVRLQKVLAEAGYGSRRACEEFITAGRVMVDGRVVTELGTKVDPGRQEVHVDGERLAIEAKRYFVVNKPSGYLCTNSDPRGRPRVVDLFPSDGPRLYTVGRLDENSRGLLLVTNDGELANKLLHPRYHVPRRYRVQVAGEPTRETYDQLVEGLHFTEGKFRVKHVKKIRTVGQSTWLELVLTEGRNREIRRLLARVGHKVMKLERIGFGPLRLGKLKPGETRPLTPRELGELEELVRTRSGGDRPGAGQRASHVKGPPKKAAAARETRGDSRGGSRKKGAGPSTKRGPRKRR